MSEGAKKLAIWLRVGSLVFGVGIAVVMIVSANPRTEFLRVSGAGIPPGALRMTFLVLALAAFYFVGGLVDARQRRLAAGTPLTVNGRPKLRRGYSRGGYGALQWQVVMCIWIFSLAYPDQWTWSSVGLKDNVPIVLSAFIGVSAYGMLLLVLTVALRLGGDEGKFLDGTVRSMAVLIPRAKRQKRLAWIAFCVFNPVIEELLFRGVLIYQTSLVLGSAWSPIAVGLLVNISNHWYQGRRSMALHVSFFIVAVALLYSPLGLAGAIGLHIAGDVVPMVVVRRQLREFRERHRRRLSEN